MLRQRYVGLGRLVVIGLYFFSLMFFGNLYAGKCIISAEEVLSIEDILKNKGYTVSNFNRLRKPIYVNITKSQFDRVSVQLQKKLGLEDPIDTYEYFKATKNANKHSEINWVQWIELAPEFVNSWDSLMLWVSLGKTFKDHVLIKHSFNLIQKKSSSVLTTDIQIQFLKEILTEIESTESSPFFKKLALEKGVEKEDFYLDQLEAIPVMESHVGSLPRYLEYTYYKSREKKGFQKQVEKWNQKLLLADPSFDISFLKMYKDALEYDFLLYTHFNFNALIYLRREALAEKFLNMEMDLEEIRELLSRFRRVGEL